MKEVVKKKLTDHIGLKLIAVLLAIVVWLVVMNIEDYSITRTFKDIPVEQLNGDTLNKIDKVYDVIDGETVDIVVKGRRTLVGSLTVDDFVASADLSKMSITNTVTINVSLKDKTKEDQVSIRCVDDQMLLSIEDKVSKQLPVVIVIQGDPSDGYALGKCKSTPNIVTITGAKSVVDKVTELRAVVEVTGRSESFDIDVTPKCYDVYGESMEGKNVFLDVDTVSVNVPIYKTKTVEVLVNTEGKPSLGYEVTNVNYHPQSVVIAGDSSQLDEIDAVVISDISVSGKTDSFELNVNTEEYLPEGIYLADSNNQIAISVTVVKLVDRSFTLSESDITLTNTSDGYNYEIIIPAGKSFTIQGLQENIETLSLTDFELSLDCTNLHEGENLVPLSIKDSGLYKIKFKAGIKIIVSVKEEVTELSTEEVTETTETQTESETTEEE